MVARSLSILKSPGFNPRHLHIFFCNLKFITGNLVANVSRLCIKYSTRKCQNINASKLRKKSIKHCFECFQKCLFYEHLCSVLDR